MAGSFLCLLPYQLRSRSARSSLVSEIRNWLHRRLRNMIDMTFDLPVELVQLTFKIAVRSQILDDPKWTTSLLLLSSSMRKYLLPIIYHLFVVEVPPDRASASTRSFSAFVDMVCNPRDPRRLAIRHLAFRTTPRRSLPRGSIEYIFGAVGPWYLTSVVGDVGLLSDLVKNEFALVLRPQVVSGSEVVAFYPPYQGQLRYRRLVDILSAQRRDTNLSHWLEMLVSDQCWDSATGIGLVLHAYQLEETHHLARQVWERALQNMVWVERGIVYLCLHLEAAIDAADAARGLIKALQGRRDGSRGRVVISFQVVGGSQVLAAGATETTAAAPDDCENVFRSAFLAEIEDSTISLRYSVFFADARGTALDFVSENARNMYEAILDSRSLLPMNLRSL